MEDLLVVAELFVGVGLQILGFGVVRISKDEVVQDLHRPPVAAGVHGGVHFAQDLVAADHPDVTLGVVLGQERQAIAVGRQPVFDALDCAAWGVRVLSTAFVADQPPAA
jgi:hypothetical protein